MVSFIEGINHASSEERDITQLVRLATKNSHTVDNNAFNREMISTIKKRLCLPLPSDLTDSTSWGMEHCNYGPVQIFPIRLVRANQYMWAAFEASVQLQYWLQRTINIRNFQPHKCGGFFYYRLWCNQCTCVPYYLCMTLLLFFLA